MYKNGQKHDINCTFTYKDYMKLLIKERKLTSLTPVISTCRKLKRCKAAKIV